MIIIGEKLNGSIPAVAKAIADKDEAFIRERALMQAKAGATFLDVCASVEEAVEVVDDLQHPGRHRRAHLHRQPQREDLRAGAALLPQTGADQLGFDGGR